MTIIFILLGLLILIIAGVVLYQLGLFRQTPVAKPSTSVLSNSYSPPELVCSEFFPDQLYVGKQVKLDNSIRVMLKNLLFLFPTEALIVDSFKYFDIDGNPFEEIDFQKIGTNAYKVLYDQSEQTMYFLNHVMSTTLDKDEVPPMASQDVVTLTEGDDIYEYTDMSGLIEVAVHDSKGSTLNKSRLIRVYEREVTPDDNEYLICIMNSLNAVDYYVGFNISSLQLEDI